jgi:hypothetical protein
MRVLQIHIEGLGFAPGFPFLTDPFYPTREMNQQKGLHVCLSFGFGRTREAVIGEHSIGSAHGLKSGRGASRRREHCR